MRNNFHSQCSRAAFTLMELIVVIAVVAVLAVILLSSLGPAIHGMRRAKCLNNMHEVGVATFSYIGEHEMLLPMQEDSAWDVPLSGYLDGKAHEEAIAVLKCPEDVRPLRVAPGRFARSYCFNANLPAKMVQITIPSQTIMLAEWYTGAGGPPGGASENFQYGGNYDIVAYSAGGFYPRNERMNAYHQNQSNFVFADGHAESIDPRITTIGGDQTMWTATRE